MIHIVCLKAGQWTYWPIVDIPWSEYGWLYPGQAAPLILPQIITNVRRVWGALRPPSHRVMKSEGLRRGQLSSPFSLLLRENGTFDDGQGTMTDPSEIWASSSSPVAARPFPKSLVTKIGTWYLVMETPGGHHHSAVNTSPHIWTSS